MPEAKAAHALRTVARGLARLGREQARSGDVTLQQAEALQIIAERRGMSTSTLALALGIDPSTASRNLAGLERAGYVLRKRATEDGRQSDAHLTARGRRVTESLSADWARASIALLDRLPRAERQRVADALDVLAKVLEPGRAE